MECIVFRMPIESSIDGTYVCIGFAIAVLQPHAVPSGLQRCPLCPAVTDNLMPDQPG